MKAIYITNGKQHAFEYIPISEDVDMYVRSKVENTNIPDKIAFIVDFESHIITPQ